LPGTERCLPPTHRTRLHHHPPPLGQGLAQASGQHALGLPPGWRFGWAVQHGASCGPPWEDRTMPDSLHIGRLARAWTETYARGEPAKQRLRAGRGTSDATRANACADGICAALSLPPATATQHLPIALHTHDTFPTLTLTPPDTTVLKSISLVDTHVLWTDGNQWASCMTSWTSHAICFVPTLYL